MACGSHQVRTRKIRGPRSSVNDITLERLKSVLHYEPVTGVWTWIKAISQRGKVGAVAGCIKDTGYRSIGVYRKEYRSNRLAHFYMTGEWPKNHIDHENLDTTDDRWNNLREATPTQNNANWGRKSTNKSGYKGVSWNKANKKWVAYLQVGRKNRNLGYFTTPEAAHERYCEEARITFGEFYRAA